MSANALWIGKAWCRLFKRSSAVCASYIVIFVIVVRRCAVVVRLRIEHTLLLLVDFPRCLLTHVALVPTQSTHLLQQLTT